MRASLAERPPRTATPGPRRRSATLAASAALVAVLIVTALVLALTRPDPARTAPARPAPHAPGAFPSSAAPPDGGPSVCGLPGGDQDAPVVPPAGTTWRLVGTMAAPADPATVGPGIPDTAGAAGLRSCYARTPLGALYAAAGFLAATTDPGLRLPALAHLTAAGAGRDRALSLLADADPGGAASGVQLAGFTFLNYDRTLAVIDLAMAVGGSAVHLPVTVRWEAGDWRVVLPDTGLPYEAIQSLPNLTGYVPWAGA